MRKKREYSKVVTTVMVTIFSVIAICFIVFVCYEMHRLKDLAPVAYIGPSVVGLLATVLAF